MGTKSRWILGAILITAAVARLYALGRVPAGVWYDEAVDGLDGIHAAIAGHWPLFYPGNFGREGLFINLIGWSERLLGVNPFALRLPSATAGVATVLFVYLLADALYSRRTALLAGWFCATAFWPVLFSRIGFRAVAAPLCLTAALYFGVEATRRQRWVLWAIAAGLACGLGFHTYPTYRIAVLVLVCVCIAEVRRAHDSRTVLRKWVVIAAIAAAVASPMVVYFATHRGSFTSRSNALVFSDEHPVLHVLYGIGVTVRMFVLDSDDNWRHNLSGAPEFGWPMAIFFLAGVIATAWNLRRRRGRWQWLPWAWLLIGVVPTVITYETPHALRASIVIPAAILLCAIGGDAMMEFARAKPIMVKAVVALALIAGANELARYFVEYAISVNATEAFVPHDALLAQLLNEEPPQTPRYVIVRPDPYTETAVRFGTYGHPTPEFFSLIDIFRQKDLSSRFPKGAVIASVPADGRAFRMLRERHVKFKVEQRGEIPIATVE